MAEAKSSGQPPASGKALGSFLLGCFSFLLLPGLAAVVVGHAARAEIKKSSGKLRGGGWALAGLILGYLGIGATLLALVYAGLPFLRASKPGSASSVVGNLRTLNIALQTYSATYGKGFPENLGQLGPAPAGAALNAGASGFVVAALASGKDSGYAYSYTIMKRDRDGLPISYVIHADPVGREASGRAHFYTDQTQVIRTEPDRVATADSTPIISVATSEEPDPKQ